VTSRVLLLTVDGQAADDVVDLLQRRNLTVSVAHDLNAALQKIGENHLIVLDARDAASLAMLCRRINDEAGSTHPPILAIAHSRDVEARVGLLEAGADDVIARPIDPRELEALVEALLLRAPTTTRSPSGQETAAPRPMSAPGRLIVFASAKGGSGTTTLAVNSALILAEMAPGSVAIADFDMYHGQVSTHLDIYARSSTASLAREDPANLTPDVIHESGRQHASGLTVFGGPYRPDDAIDVSAAQLIALTEQLRTTYGTVVVDAGSTLDMRALAVIQTADRVALILTPDIPALRLLHASLQVLSEQGAAADRSVFIVNQIYPKAMIGGEQIEEHLGIKVGFDIPYDGESFVKAVNEGQPLVSMAHRSPAATAIRRLAGHLTDTSVETAEAAPAPKRGGLFRGLLGRD
jgi:pilus assembly protein CpaE